MYQTIQTVFHRLSKHLEFRQKYSAACRIFTLFSVFGYPAETLFLVFDLALINHAGDLYGRILTEVVSTDRTR